MDIVNQNKTPKNFVNFRPLFYGFLAFAIGISFSYYIFSFNISYIIILCILACISFGIAIWRKKFVNLIVIISCFGFGTLAYFIDSKNFTSINYAGQECVVQGRVSTNIYENDNTTYVILQDVIINNQKSSNLALTVYSAGSDFVVENGQVLKFTADVYDEFLFENGQFNSFAYKMSASHNSFVNAEDITIVVKDNLTLAENIRLYVKNLLHNFMPYETAELSYSILFGDQVKLDEEIKTSFSTSGLGHLVAVSGLNIAVLVACLYWILARFRINRWFKFLVITIILLSYSYLCSFAPSVVRASIMALICLGCMLFGRQYDLLSSLGIAGITILVISPFSVFDAGFLMSFISVIAIAILTPPLSKFFKNKCKIPEKVSTALAIDITTTLAISPILALYFQKISFFSWLTNLICVPLFSLAYILVFALVFVVSILGFLGFLFYIPSIIMQFIIWFSELIAGLDFAIIYLYSLPLIGVFAFYLCLFICGKMFIAKPFEKIIASSISVVVAFVLILAVDRPFVPNSSTYTQLNSPSPCAVLTSANGDVLVISNGNNQFLDEYLVNNRINNITTFVSTSPENALSVGLISKYKPKNIIYSGHTLQEYGSFSVRYIYENETLKAIYVKEEVGILFAVDRIGSVQAENIKTQLLGYDLGILYENRTTKNFLSVADFKYVFSQDRINVENNYSTKINGTFTISTSGGIIGEVRCKN